jgi:hypothetical protein
MIWEGKNLWVRYIFVLLCHTSSSLFLAICIRSEFLTLEGISSLPLSCLT